MFVVLDAIPTHPLPTLSRCELYQSPIKREGFFAL